MVDCFVRTVRRVARRVGLACSALPCTARWPILGCGHVGQAAAAVRRLRMLSCSRRLTASLLLHAPGWLALQVREEGVQALFKGLAPNYVKVVPSIAIAFVTYEQVRLRLLKLVSSCVQELTFMCFLLGGVCC